MKRTLSTSSTWGRTLGDIEHDKMHSINLHNDSWRWPRKDHKLSLVPSVQLVEAGRTRRFARCSILYARICWWWWFWIVFLTSPWCLESWCKREWNVLNFPNNSHQKYSRTFTGDDASHCWNRSEVTDARCGDFGDLDVSPAVIDCSLATTSFGARSRNQRSMAAECSSKNAPTSSSSSSEHSESGGADRWDGDRWWWVGDWDWDMLDRDVFGDSRLPSSVEGRELLRIRVQLALSPFSAGLDGRGEPSFGTVQQPVLLSLRSPLLLSGCSAGSDESTAEDGTGVDWTPWPSILLLPFFCGQSRVSVDSMAL